MWKSRSGGCRAELTLKRYNQPAAFSRFSRSVEMLGFVVFRTLSLQNLVLRHQCRSAFPLGVEPDSLLRDCCYWSCCFSDLACWLPTETLLLNIGQSRSRSAEQGKYNKKRKYNSARPSPPFPHAARTDEIKNN